LSVEGNESRRGETGPPLQAGQTTLNGAAGGVVQVAGKGFSFAFKTR
jgi:hypothetical protein